MSACWNDRGRRAQDECHVTVARCDNFFLDVGLLRHVRPIRDHGHHAIRADTDQNVRLIVDWLWVRTHGLFPSHPPDQDRLRPASPGNSGPQIGSSAPFPLRPRQVELRARGSSTARISAVRSRRCAGAGRLADAAVARRSASFGGLSAPYVGATGRSPATSPSASLAVGVS